MKSGITGAPLSTARWRAGLSARRRSWRNQTMAGGGDFIPVDRKVRRKEAERQPPNYASTRVRQSNLSLVRCDLLIRHTFRVGFQPGAGEGKQPLAADHSHFETAAQQGR